VATGIPDELVRTIEVRASRERVWAAITDPGELQRWFPEHAEVDLRMNGEMHLMWEAGADEAVIEVLDPPSTFAFRWRPAGTDRPYTRVTFTLSGEGDVTTVTLTERGFAALPDQIHEQSYEGNAAGWTSELEELRAYLESA
jgi:uncharacterized protein YndB with AHSA1/START domain